jgi:hypothetical protein
MEFPQTGLPCARCLAVAPAESNEPARCPSCDAPCADSARRWARFVQRDARVLAFALGAIAVCLGISIVPGFAVSCVSLWIDPKLVQSGVQGGFTPGLILMGVVGMAAGCAQLLAYIGWIIAFAISFGSVFARATMPLAVVGGSTVAMMVVGMALGMVAVATNGGNPAAAQQSIIASSMVIGGVQALISIFGVAWIISALQRSFTTDRRGVGLLFGMSALSFVGTIAALGSGLVSEGAPIDSTPRAATLVVSAVATLAFQALVVLRLIRIRRLALARAAEVASVINEASAVPSGMSTPPLMHASAPPTSR